MRLHCVYLHVHCIFIVLLEDGKHFPFQVKVDKLEALEDVSSNKVMRNKILQILVPFTDEKL